MMRHLLIPICCFALSLSASYGQGKDFIKGQDRISASIPGGWKQVEGVRHETVLKLVRSAGGQNAVIAVFSDPAPEGRGATDFDIWDMSDADIREAARGESFQGETASVLDLGRANVDGVHFVWYVTRRRVLDAEVWEYVYEGVRGSRQFTIRLTSFGNNEWFASNRPVFTEFVGSLRFS